MKNDKVKNLNWCLIHKYPGGHKHYYCRLHKTVRSNDYLIEGRLSVAHIGRNTAFVIFRGLCINFTNIRFGFRMSKHFEGHNASHKARAWFRYMYNNYPDHVDYVEFRRPFSQL